jgi:hypothetical protein
MTSVLEVVLINFNDLSGYIFKACAHRVLAILVAYFLFFPHFQSPLVAHTVQPPTTLYEVI